MQVTASDVAIALREARAAGAASVRAAPAEGAVGAGTGMTCLGYKGGIGTSSRLVPSGHAVGVLLLSNFGAPDRLTIDGVPAGQLMPGPGRGQSRPPAGSCITVVVTDAPIDSAGCARLARRAGLGLARTGSTAHHGSGEIFLALATGLRAARGEPSAAAGPPLPGAGCGRPGSFTGAVSPISGRGLDPFFDAVVEATEEAVLNSMLTAPTVTGRDGNTSPGLDSELVRDLLVAAGRISA